MINLLPPETKQSYSYARRNLALRSWVLALVLVLVGLVIIGTYGLVAIHKSYLTYNRQVATAQAALDKQHLVSTEKQVQSISDSLRLAVKVLSQEVLFSKLISQIGAVMPNGAILIGLDINNTTGGLTLSAAATNYTTATQTQVNLTDPANKIFAKVDILSINCANNPSDPHHPCAVQLRALFNTKNQFLFINQGAKQ